MIETTLAANSLSDAIANDLIPVIAIGGGLVFAGFCIACGMIKSVSITKARESTKREMAAYVAEGTVQPDDAVRILSAGHGTDAKEMVAKRAADGWISAKKADQIMQSLDKNDPARA
jgi:hypothetical protein